MMDFTIGSLYSLSGVMLSCKRVPKVYLSTGWELPLVKFLLGWRQGALPTEVTCTQQCHLAAGFPVRATREEAALPERGANCLEGFCPAQSLVLLEHHTPVLLLQCRHYRQPSLPHCCILSIEIFSATESCHSFYCTFLYTAEKQWETEPVEPVWSEHLASISVQVQIAGRLTKLKCQCYPCQHRTLHPEHVCHLATRENAEPASVSDSV